MSGLLEASRRSLFYPRYPMPVDRRVSAPAKVLVDSGCPRQQPRHQYHWMINQQLHRSYGIAQLFYLYKRRAARHVYLDVRVTPHHIILAFNTHGYCNGRACRGI